MHEGAESGYCSSGTSHVPVGRPTLGDGRLDLSLIVTITRRYDVSVGLPSSSTARMMWAVPATCGVTVTRAVEASCRVRAVLAREDRLRRRRDAALARRTPPNIAAKAADDHRLRRESRCRPPDRRTTSTSGALPSGSCVPVGIEHERHAASGVDRDRRLARLAIHDDDRVVVGVAGAFTVQSIRAAKSCWKAVRQRQIVAWSVV